MSSKPRIIVGLSGGVDSSVAAWLLKAQGYAVEGLFMKNWEEDDTATYCAAKQDLKDAQEVCKTLDIPLHTVNFAQEYWEKVFSLFLEGYQKGRTPNPDILCNKEIKFNAFLSHALQLGADAIATGHYATLTSPTQKIPYYQLCKGIDPNKDQSYFLYTLTQKALSRSFFPLGHLTKTVVRQLAKAAHLVTSHKKDSTGICFIGKRKFKPFLQEFLHTKPGPIQTPQGKTIGFHEGLPFYTLGQRQGLHIGGQKDALQAPWYVVGKSLKENILYVTQDSEDPWHFCRSLIAKDLHWIAEPPSSFSQEIYAKTRYRQDLQLCRFSLHSEGVEISFASPQRAVTPGQSIVFYHHDTCLGGGIIDATDSPGGLHL